MSLNEGGQSLGAANFATGQVTLTTTGGAIIVPARLGGITVGRVSVTIVNQSSTSVALGPTAGVTFTTGQVLPGVVGASITIATTAAVYGSLQSAGTALLTYHETY